MQLSFNGVIVPYVYRCPQAFKFRNINRIVLPTLEPVEDAEISARAKGIEKHTQTVNYISGVSDDCSFATDKIESLRRLYLDRVDGSLVFLEKEWLFDRWWNPLTERPPKGSGEDFIYMRTDAVLVTDNYAEIYDWKFANPEFGASVHYNEISWFAAGLFAQYPDIGEVRVDVHYPEAQYSLPVRTYSRIDGTRLQQQYVKLLNKIRNDKFFWPAPSKAHCRFCDYRSVDSGGSGHCDDSSV
jgi:hypothetical protein